MDKFCGQCGSDRIEGARFCVHCGAKFKSSGMQGRDIVGVGLTVVVVLTLFIFAGVKWGILDQGGPTIDFEAPVFANVVPEQSLTVQDPHIQELRRMTADGHPAAMIDLAEHLLAASINDREVLTEAAEAVQRFLTLFPEHDYALRLLSNIYFDATESEKAVDAYRNYLARNPDDANAYVDLGTQLLALDRKEDAIIEYKNAIELFPNFYNAHFNLYITFLQLKDQDQAVEYKQKAEKINREFGQIGPANKNHPRLPEGVEPIHAPVQGQAVPVNTMAESSVTRVAPKPAAEQAPAEAESEATDYGKFANVEAFFRTHFVIGPKMSGFEVEGDQATLLVTEFPMDAIPPNMRQSLDAKIQTYMDAIEGEAKLAITDAASGRVMATYEKGV